MTGSVHVGTSGWSYDAWKDAFYAGVPRRKWLAHYASEFSTVEINATFYRLQKITTFQNWYATTPAGFRFAIKANRYLTAFRQLRDPARSIALERERALGLAEKLAVVLWQFPATLARNSHRLEAFAAALLDWREVRHAVEFRDPSWFVPHTRDCLHEHGLAVCQSDAADWPLWEAVSTDLVYVRLHGHTRTYVSAYSGKSLRRWAERIGGWRRADRDVHVYFDNTDAGAAVRDARRLLDLLTHKN